MDKSPEAFRTISEVADALDVPPHVLRFWETRFTQVKPVKRGGGRRYYRPEDVRLLRGIRGLLYDDGMTIKGVQKILRERGIRHVIGLGTLDDESPARPSAARAPFQESASAPPAPAEPVAAPFDEGGPRALFETLLAEPAPAAKVAEAGAESSLASAGAPAPVILSASVRKAALVALVAELEALRTVMAAKP